MHREPTKRKLPLRAARSVRGSPSSSSRPEGRRCLHPGVETPAEARLRRARAPGAGEAAANGGAGDGERAPVRPGTGREDTHRSGRAGRPHPGAPAARQDGSGRRSHREGESARPQVPSGPLRLPERTQSRFLRTELGDPSSAGCPRQAPTPFPGRLPFFTLFPSPHPPTPTRMENTSRGGGRREHASLKGSLP